MVLSALNPRHRSLPRGITLVLGSLVLAFLLAGFPDDRPSLKLLIPTIAAVLPRSAMNDRSWITGSPER